MEGLSNTNGEPKFIPTAIFTVSDIIDLLVKHGNGLRLFLDKLQESFRHNYGWKWGNSNWLLQDDSGFLFRFCVFKDRFIVWSIKDEVIFSAPLDKDVEEYLTRLRGILYKYGHNVIEYSGCGANCDYNLVRHQRFFAGVYCNQCWEDKYKKEEAKETYD